MELKCLFEFIFGNILFLGDIIKSNFVVRENELCEVFVLVLTQDAKDKRKI